MAAKKKTAKKSAKKKTAKKSAKKATKKAAKKSSKKRTPSAAFMRPVTPTPRSRPWSAAPRCRAPS